MTDRPDKAKLLEDFMSAAWALTAAKISEREAFNEKSGNC
jgi:hypothetical protein